ncbi:MAG: Flp pilus assembly complex ATPase component [Deltaproteobacteria bacterium]|nr:Flp pilus assembly complex ATPase component [Deltaproteobacteria bacterium]
MTGKGRKRLGEVLVDAGLINQDQLTDALSESARSGIRVGKVLVDRGVISETDLTRALSNQLKIEMVSLKEAPPDGDLVDLLPETLARRYSILPYRLDGDTLVVVMADPLNVFATDALRGVTGRSLRKVIASESEIGEWIGDLYGRGSLLGSALADAIADSVTLGEGEESPDRLMRLARETPVVRLVNALLGQAIGQRASDIHIEPQEKEVRIRVRIDGILEEAAKVPSHLKLALTSRIKIVSGMDIAEKRIPQDGRFRWTEGTHDVDVRASTLPTVYGEKVVLRILDRASDVLDLSELGFGEEHQVIIRDLIHRPYGIILLTGPTGSGKTTTLYAALNEINVIGRNIVTVEDPVEYEIAGLNQVQVAPNIGLGFSSVLRNVLRQDPDVIMVGEIRDAETANIAVHAALTGHLVFSTLHTNDAAGGIPRLLELGVEPYLIRASVLGFLGQRLVRRICPQCRTEVSLSPDVRSLLWGEWVGETFFQGHGCDECRETGYHGRTGIAEIFKINRRIRDLVAREISHEALSAELRKEGFVSMREDGIAKAAKGETSLEEVFRVTQDVEL